MKSDKKRIAVINSVPDQSTGKIAYGLFRYFKNKKAHVVFCYGYGGRIENAYKIDYKFEHYFHVALSRITGLQGYYSTLATKRLIRFLKKKQINTVYAVNLHGYYINERLFFKYIAKNRIKFIYIMADEYPFCGKCGYRQECRNNEVGCGNCPQVHEYPKSILFDRTRKIYKMKYKAYRLMSEPVFVGPEYTILQARKSPALQNLSVHTIDEAVNTDFYFPREIKKIREKLRIKEDKVICVCVAPSNYERKGTRYFTEVARKLEKDDRYVFVHVGYMGDVSKLPSNYIAIGFERDQERLAQIYSLGDIFVFPSLLDTMPNACLEALSCGTPLMCFNVSGMPYIGDETVMSLIETGNIEQMVNAIKSIKKKDDEIINTCRNYAIERYSYSKYFALLDKVAIFSED